jgi:hypothetical protein
MAGIAPLSYGTISEWARLMDIDITSLEVQGLILLDAVIRNPEQFDEDEEPDEPKDTQPWPEQNHG